MSVDYRAYMASNDWAVRRVAALTRTVWDGCPRCEMCGRPGDAFKNRIEDSRYRIENANGLNVHHLHYRNLGQEEPEDLIVLCTDDLYYDAYNAVLNRWGDNGFTGPEPTAPERVGCHERTHDDPAFRREVARRASERW